MYDTLTRTLYTLTSIDTCILHAFGMCFITFIENKTQSTCSLQRLVDVSTQLQQAQADLMASRRNTQELSDQLTSAEQQVQVLDSSRLQLTQVATSACRSPPCEPVLLVTRHKL